jgi:hypothetical protein
MHIELWWRTLMESDHLEEREFVKITDKNLGFWLRGWEVEKINSELTY